MAGYLFNLNSHESLEETINLGIFSTVLSNPTNNLWKIHHHGTFADYCSMKEGDNVYFFIKRKIYGIGLLVNLNGSCKYLNYPEANKPTIQNIEVIRPDLLYKSNYTDNLKLRYICLFRPSPFFFKNGVDMDEMLLSAPEKFKILRAFQQLSCIKFTDEENQAFKDKILRKNLEVLTNPNGENKFNSDYINSHRNITVKLNENYNFSVQPILERIVNKNGSISNEMAIEASLIHQLNSGENNVIDVFGKWDYISHQVISSPFKPLHYIDKMDIFGYSFIANQFPTISKYLVIEMKKGVIDTQDIYQLMKYVDWVKNEYCSGDYGMIQAFMVGYDYSDGVIEDLQKIISRSYIKEYRPYQTEKWSNVKLIKYKYTTENRKISYTQIAR